MIDLETNIFPILNLSELTTHYRLYKIRGLRGKQAENYQNRQILIRRLSYALKTPVTVIDLEEKPHLVLPANAPEPPSPYQLVRGTVRFESTGEPLRLDYSLRSPENDEICRRFIQFMLQAPLYDNPKLWQPGTGQPFFEKEPKQIWEGAVSLYQGFAVRAAIAPSGTIGLYVDVQHRFVACDPLPNYLDYGDFQKYKGKHCIYHFGNRWYDIQLYELSDLNISEQRISCNNKLVPLINYAVAQSQKPLPADLAAVPHDSAVVSYLNNQDEERYAIAALCYPVYDTEDRAVKRYHKHTILQPHLRREMIHSFVNRYLTALRFGDNTLRISEKPEQVAQRIIAVPDYEFGNSYKLSVRGTEGLPQVSLDSLGKKRTELLSNEQAGFYVKERFDRQYLLLPQSVADSFGSRFVDDLKYAVNKLYPEGGGYDPVLISYNDRRPKTFVEQGKAILQAAQQYDLQPGYCLVMLHHTTDRQSRQHDQLAAMAIRELRGYDLYAAVMHSATGQECYEYFRDKQGKPCYRIREEKRRKLKGYLRGVALNKVLLTNERWPFVLATPLNADITIGIDVKHNTAGFTIVSSNGSKIRTICWESRQKERLLDSQMKKRLIEIIKQEADAIQRESSQLSSEVIRTIVLHRDGRVYQSEIDGAYQAVEALKEEGIIAPDATLTILEISKSSPAPLRLFDVTENGRESPWVENPQIGCFHIINGKEGYICTTGRAFPRHGTVKPLHIRFVEGGLPFEKCLEDIYYLTALAWTRPEDCTRYPITIKLTDRRLGEDASEYDADTLQMEMDEDELDEDNTDNLEDEADEDWEAIA